MRVNLKELTQQEDRLAPGHRLCPGCGEPTVVRQVLLSIPGPVVVSNATGCLEVSTSPYPYTSWRVPWIHSAFANAAATISGVEAAYEVLKRRGKVQEDGITFVTFAGDGGTYDIGLQALSGALERGHRFLYVCLNNEAYMNTGIQRSSATPEGAWTTTSPAGSVIPGKQQPRKDMTAIVAAHRIPYVAQASPHAWRDLMTKVQKAVAVSGPSFINVLAPCPRGWRSEPEETIALGKLAADTCTWPLFEVEDGRWQLNYTPSPKRPVLDWVKSQGRFSHLIRPENQELLSHIQADVDKQWETLQQRCGLRP